MSETAVMTTAEVADELGTDPKTLRKFFRSDACDTVTPVGQGKRYAITPDDIDDLRVAFDAWSSGKAKKADAVDDDKAPSKAKAKKAKKNKKAKPAPPVEDPDEDLDMGDEEPTAEDLDEIEDLDLDDE